MAGQAEFPQLPTTLFLHQNNPKFGNQYPKRILKKNHANNIFIEEIGHHHNLQKSIVDIFWQKIVEIQVFSQNVFLKFLISTY